MRAFFIILNIYFLEINIWKLFRIGNYLRVLVSHTFSVIGRAFAAVNFIFDVRKIRNSINENVGNNNRILHPSRRLTLLARKTSKMQIFP